MDMALFFYFNITDDIIDHFKYDFIMVGSMVKNKQWLYLVFLGIYLIYYLLKSFLKAVSM